MVSYPRNLPSIGSLDYEKPKNGDFLTGQTYMEFSLLPIMEIFVIWNFYKIKDSFIILDFLKP